MNNPCHRLSFFGLFLAGMAAFPPSARAAADDPARPLLAAVRAAVAEGRVEQSRELGFTLGKKQFREAPEDGGLLTGLDIGLGKWLDIENIYAVRAVYWTREGDFRLQEHGLFRDKPLPNGKARKTKVLRTVHIQARPGYAVGGLTVRSGLNINGLSVTFMKIDGNALDPTHSYASDWVGDQTGGGESTVDGDGAPVIGLFGSQDEEKVTALGLVYATQPAAALAPPPVVLPADPPPNATPPRAAERPPAAVLPAVRPPHPAPREVEPPQEGVADEAPQAAPHEIPHDPVADEPTVTTKKTVVPPAAPGWPLWASVAIPAGVFVGVAAVCLLAVVIPWGRQTPQIQRAPGRREVVRPKAARVGSSSDIRTTPRRPAFDEKEVLELRAEDILDVPAAADEPLLEVLPVEPPLSKE